MSSHERQPSSGRVLVAGSPLPVSSPTSLSLSSNSNSNSNSSANIQFSSILNSLNSNASSSRFSRSLQSFLASPLRVLLAFLLCLFLSFLYHRSVLHHLANSNQLTEISTRTLPSVDVPPVTTETLNKEVKDRIKNDEDNDDEDDDHNDHDDHDEDDQNNEEDHDDDQDENDKNEDDQEEIEEKAREKKRKQLKEKKKGKKGQIKKKKSGKKGHEEEDDSDDEKNEDGEDEDKTKHMKKKDKSNDHKDEDHESDKADNVAGSGAGADIEGPHRSTFSSEPDLSSSSVCTSFLSSPSPFHSGSATLYDRLVQGKYEPLARSLLTEASQLMDCDSDLIQQVTTTMKANCDDIPTWNSPWSFFQIYHNESNWSSMLPNEHGFRTNGTLRNKCDLSVEELMPTLYNSPLSYQQSEFNAIIPLGLVGTCIPSFPSWIGQGSWKRKIANPCNEFSSIPFDRLNPSYMIKWSHHMGMDWWANTDNAHPGMMKIIDDFMRVTFNVPAAHIGCDPGSGGWPCCSVFMMHKTLYRYFSQFHLLSSLYFIAHYDPTADCPYQSDPWMPGYIYRKERCWGYAQERLNILFQTQVVKIHNVAGRCDGSEVRDCGENERNVKLEGIEEALRSLACRFGIELAKNEPIPPPKIQ